MIRSFFLPHQDKKYSNTIQISSTTTSPPPFPWTQDSPQSQYTFLPSIRECSTREALSGSRWLIERVHAVSVLILYCASKISMGGLQVRGPDSAQHLKSFVRFYICKWGLIGLILLSLYLREESFIKLLGSRPMVVLRSWIQISNLRTPRDLSHSHSRLAGHETIVVP